jgi:hypothetical protein
MPVVSLPQVLSLLRSALPSEHVLGQQLLQGLQSGLDSLLTAVLGISKPLTAQSALAAANILQGNHLKEPHLACYDMTC